MAAKELPAQDVLNQLLSYNTETGDLLWKERGPEWFNATEARTPEHTAKIWNLRYAGKPALHNISANFYREGHLFGVSVKSHRVIWKMMTGDEPDQVDHINGIRSDNIWENLRDVDQSANQRNASIRSDNTSGVVGVSWYQYPPERTVGGKWLVKVGNKHIGFYKSFDEAVAARKAAEHQYGFHENHGKAA